MAGVRVKSRTHLVIPDCQVRPGVNTDHLEALGNFIYEKRPDVVVQLGDFCDLESLSSYATALEREGRRYQKDINACAAAMKRLTSGYRGRNYRPREVMTLGNHEDRIRRMVEDHPLLDGTISMDDLPLRGWETHPFLRPVRIDGIEYAHYFTTGVKGNPCSSARAMLNVRQGSCISGHVQTVDVAFHAKTRRVAISAGLFTNHDEKYLGPQGNSTWSGVWVLHEVNNGRFDIMQVSKDFLLKRYL